MNSGWTTTHKIPKRFTVKDLLLKYEESLKHRSTKTTLEKLPFYLSKLDSISLVDANGLPIRRYPEHRRESWIPPEYMPKFLKLAHSELSSARSTQWAALLFALYTGQRRANILQITNKNIIQPNRWLIPASEHKGKRNTTVYLSSFARAVLPIREGRLFPIYEVRGALEEVEQKIGLKISMHSMRHTFVSYAFRAKLSPVVVSKLTGHSVGFTASQYGHIDESDLMEGVERIGEEIKKAGHNGPDVSLSLYLFSQALFRARPQSF